MIYILTEDGAAGPDDGDGRPFCKMDKAQRCTEPPISARSNRWQPRTADPRPDWCPLELGPVTVEVERG